MPDDFLTGSLQESLLTLLAFDDNHGRQVIGLLDLKYFDRPYRDLAEKIIDFRGRFKRPPGVEHLDDLFDTMLESGDKDRRALVKDMLQSMVRQSHGLNAEFVASRVKDFIRRQTLKDALVRGGERIGQGGDGAEDDVSAILEKALKQRSEAMDLGTRLGDIDSALGFLDHPSETFSWGIKEFDKRGLGPTRKELLLYIAARKRGKSWAMAHLGKEAMLVDKVRVLHLSLEMGEAKVSQRYLQSIFGVAKRPDRNLITRLEMDEFGHVAQLVPGHQVPRLHLQDPDIRSKLAKRMRQSGTRFGNLIIKAFPSGALTMSKLQSYLDYLDARENFTPDLMIVDYPDLFQIDPKNLRTETGRVYVGLRGVADERNMAVVAPSQGNRDATNAREVDETNVAEDISKVATADTVISYSQTKAEKKLKLARLTVTNARNDEDGFSVLISQNYAVGQFCLQSAMISNRYELALREAAGDPDRTTDED